MANEKWSQQSQITNVDSSTTWLCAIDGITPANRIIKPINLGLLPKNSPSATGSFTLTANEPIIYLDSTDGCAIINKIGATDVFSIQTNSAYMDSSIKSLNRLLIDSPIIMLRTSAIDNSADYNVTLNQSGVFNMTGVTVIVANGVNAKDAVNKEQLDSKMNLVSMSNGNIDINFIVNLVGLGFDLSYAQLSHLNASNANLSKAHLSHANLYEANLANTNFYGADLSYANMVDIISLTGATFSSANLSYANLDSDGLYNAIWTYANLSNAIGLSNKYLYGINFAYVNLYNVNLSNSTLTNANWYGARLVNVNFSGASGLNPEINSALSVVNKNPNNDNLIWTLTWIDGAKYKCTPLTGSFSIN
jgi:uncharacterized protein YjbI with pentapeptide repeats